MSSHHDARVPQSAVVVQTGFLGDAVLASGIIRSLHDIGVTRIGVVVRADVAEIFEGHPAITDLYPFRKREAGATAAMITELRRASYEAAIVPHRSMRSTLLVYRAGVPRRIGFRQAALALLHTDRVHYSIARHELERNAMLVERLGVAVPSEARRSWLEPDAHSVGRLVDSGFAGAVVIAPGSIWATKRWKREGYVEVARALASGGRRVVLVGSVDDRELCRSITTEAGLPETNDLSGAQTLRELVALLSIASRVVCNDSAPLHIAEAVGTPVTALFGPTVPGFGFAPALASSSALGVELSCRPCRIHGSARCPIGTHECMTSIATSTVIETIR